MADKASNKNNPLSEESSFVEAFEANFNDKEVLKKLNSFCLLN